MFSFQCKLTRSRYLILSRSLWALNQHFCCTMLSLETFCVEFSQAWCTYWVVPLYLHRESPNQAETTGEETEDIDKVAETESNLHAAAANSGSDSAPPAHSTLAQDSLVHGDSRLAGGHSPTSYDCNISPYVKTSAKTITRALLRSSRIRRKVTVEDLFSPAKDKKEAEEKDLPSHSSSGQEELGTSKKDTSLLGYDAQWCWVESQDDVTFLWFSSSGATLKLFWTVIFQGWSSFNALWYTPDPTKKKKLLLVFVCLLWIQTIR